MTSRHQTKQCFVYITPPGETRAVTAAKFELSFRGAVPTGRFVYGRTYLERADAVEIDPIELTLGATPPPTMRLGGVYGALRDASPDHWGRLVIDRALGVPKLDEVEYLLRSADERAGALSFGHNQRPPAPNRNFNKVLKLAQLQETALAILRDKAVETPDEEQARRLLLVGTAMGGARPKAVVESDDGVLWMAKFAKPDNDRWGYARVEHGMLRLAERCGVTASHSQVVEIGGRDVLLVKRFDREKVPEGYRRARMVSALTLLQTDENAPDEWSYPALAEAVRRVCSQPAEQGAELFRRMAFNALVSNLDDHPRNHAIIALDRDWKLSPAYDLTPSPTIGMERDLAMIVGDYGRRATAENLVSQAQRFLISPQDAAQIVDRMEKQVRAEWYRIMKKAKVSERDCETIRSAFENEGFGFRVSLTSPPKKKAARKSPSPGGQSARKTPRKKRASSRSSAR